MNNEQFAAAKRNWLGWIALIVLLGLMLVVELSNSLSFKHKDSEAKRDPDEIALKYEVSRRRADDLVASSDGNVSSSIGLSAQASLNAPIQSLAARIRTDVEAAREYGAMLTEQGKAVSAAALTSLRNSTDPRDHALAEIFAAKTLTRSGARSLGAQLPDEPFVYRLVKIQALEKAGDHAARHATFTGQLALGLSITGLGAGGILFGSTIVWMLVLGARRQGKFVPLGIPAEAQTLPEADRLAVRAAQIIALFLFLSILVTAQVGPSKDPARVANASAECGVLILICLPLLARLPIDGHLIPLEKVGISLSNVGRHVLWGIGGFFFEFPISLALLLLGLRVFRFLPAPTHPSDEQLMHAKNLAATLPILFFGSVTAPIWEEFAFRGLIFPALSRVFGRLWPSAVVSSLVFAMVHPQGISAWVGLASIGVVGCALTYQTRSLIPTIVMHMAHNTVIFISALLAMAPV